MELSFYSWWLICQWVRDKRELPGEIWNPIEFGSAHFEWVAAVLILFTLFILRPFCSEWWEINTINIWCVCVCVFELESRVHSLWTHRTSQVCCRCCFSYLLLLFCVYVFWVFLIFFLISSWYIVVYRRAESDYVRVCWIRCTVYTTFYMHSDFLWNWLNFLFSLLLLLLSLSLESFPLSIFGSFFLVDVYCNLAGIFLLGWILMLTVIIIYKIYIQ